jgi:glycosyltransferase involved in cell wall biosynthesis
MKHIVIDARNRRSSTGRYTARLLEHLQAELDSCRVTVLVQSTDDWQPTAPNWITTPCDTPQFSLNLLHDFRFARQLYRLKPDLVHFTMTQQPLTYFGDIVTTTHDLTMFRFTRPGKSSLPVFLLKKLGYRLLFWQAHRKSKHVIVPSEFVKRDLTQHYPFTAGKTSVTYEASEPPLSVTATPLKDVSMPFIMHVGSPFPHKNIHNLIKAFELLKKDYPTLQLVLAGKKEHYFEELEQWAQERASYKDIHFTGFVSDAELKWLYQEAEAYVLPSLSEGFGLPGLEAMAHKCPLVSSSATCLPEVYGDAANFFDPSSDTDMARAIREVLKDKKLREKLVKNGTIRLGNFSWKTMAEQTATIYRRSLTK